MIIRQVCYHDVLRISASIETLPQHPPAPRARSRVQALRLTAIPTIVSVIVCALVLCFVLRLFRLNLHVPLNYWGDALYIDTWAKGLMEGNWPWHNPRLGMPFGADWRDFPVNLTIEAIAIRVVAIFTSSPGLVLNLVWLLGTAASAGFAAYCLQRLGVERWVASCLGIIYALQPFTFFRGVSHFNLMFYLVPLLATGAIEIAAGRFPASQSYSSHPASSRRARLTAILHARPGYIYLACLAQGFTYIYNSFFSIVLFAVAGLLAYAIYRRRSSLVASALAISIICCATLVNLAPSLTYWSQHGRNAAMAYKAPVQAEIYGLKLRHLLTPIPENPLPPLRYIEKKLNGAGFADENENATSRLGTIGSVGLLFLLGWALISSLREPFPSNQVARIVGACSALTLTCFLLATVGGFGSVFNVFVAPDIRCYNRIVVFIDFFAITAVGLLLTQARVWCLRRHWPKPALMGALCLLVVFGVSDQAVTAPYVDQSRENQFRLDAAFVRAVESVLPRNASVFQLPFTEFPSDPPPFHMLAYDHSRAYLHSDTLRWSWGAISGRQAAEWDRQTSSLPVKDMVSRLSAAGFSGIWIDRFGYSPGASPEQEIGAVLGRRPLLRSDGRIVFYDLSAYNKQLKASETSRDAGLAEQYALHPVEVAFPVGFYVQEQNDKQTWRWSLQHSVIRLSNPLPQTRTVKLAMTLQTGSARQEKIRISAAGQFENVDVTVNTTPYVREIQLSPEQMVNVSFDCGCQPIKAPGDSRTMYFAVINLKVLE